tara:strand:- start:622 stop:2610 length:1989 start_codon:yes stop_codon:yes gene_type:complete
MSGQPNINPLDPQKFRDAYMATLNLRADLDDINLQANKLYNRTGQLPAEVTDNRTTTEKLLDIVRLRVEVRNKLKEIADGTQANKISVELTPREVVFYAQQSPLINNLIRMRYAQGVLADIFIPFLQKYMSETAGNFGVASGLQQASGPNVILNAANILRGLIDAQNLDALVKVTEDRAGTPTRTAMVRAAQRLKGLIPSVTLHIEVDEVKDATLKNDLLFALNGALREFPSKFEAIALVNEYMRWKLNPDTTLREKAIGNMLQSLTISPEAEMQLRYIRQQLDGYRARAVEMGQENIFLTPNLGYKPAQADIRGELVEPIDYAASAYSAAVAERTGEAMGNKGFSPDGSLTTSQNEIIESALGFGDASSIGDFESEGPPSSINEILPSQEDVDDEAPEPEERTEITAELLADMTGGAIKAYFNNLRTEWAKETGGTSNGLRIGGIARTSWNNLGMRNGALLTWATNAETLTDANRLIGDINSAKRSGGSGFKDRAPRGKRMIGKGIAQTQRFVPFGRYVINQHRLNSDIVAVKRPCGSCLKTFPSCRVGGRLGKVIRKIVGGSIPQFEDFQDLDDDERSYLHKLAKSANILDRLSIPAPNKDAQQKMIDQFEVLKGEIMAGNDNKDLVKKFKIMILKLSNSQMLPKAQVRELLVDLASMGF